MPKRSSSEIEQALNAPSSDEEDLDDKPLNMWMWDTARGKPFSDDEKLRGKVATYKEICRYMKSVRVRDVNHWTELLNLRYENECLRAQVRQYRRKARKIARLAHAAVEREDYINETANTAIKNGSHATARPMDSDDEDEMSCNKVLYTSAIELHADENE